MARSRELYKYGMRYAYSYVWIKTGTFCVHYPNYLNNVHYYIMPLGKRHKIFAVFCILRNAASYPKSKKKIGVHKNTPKIRQI